MNISPQYKAQKERNSYELRSFLYACAVAASGLTLASFIVIGISHYAGL